MERRAKDLMQILDDELDHHPKGYVYRNYDIYTDYLTAAKERYVPLINLMINNPGGRVGKSAPMYPRRNQDETFKIVLEIVHPPYLGNQNLDQLLVNNNFQTTELDTETTYIYYGKNVLCKGSITGELTLNNYDQVLGGLANTFRLLGWNNLGKRLGWLHKIFKKVYTGLPPAPQKPKMKQGHLF